MDAHTIASVYAGFYRTGECYLFIHGLTGGAYRYFYSGYHCGRVDQQMLQPVRHSAIPKSCLDYLNSSALHVGTGLHLQHLTGGLDVPKYIMGVFKEM